MRALIGAAAQLSASGAFAQAAPPAAPDYRQDASWLCLPGADDICAKPLATTALNANGYGSNGESRPAAAPPVDCFYVYPTISMDPGGNSDMSAGAEERDVTLLQFARFGGVCRTFAPIYRQVTLTALQLVLQGKPGGDIPLAYADVKAAWREYLQHRNGGRPYVLIGHSQGTLHLARLIAEEIEGEPEAARMLSALLIGYNVEVPQGKPVGGTFKQTPLCTGAGQTGCIVTYVSFPADVPPPTVGRFGRTATPGMTIGCTDPSRLHGGDGRLDSYWYTQPTLLTALGPKIEWSREGAPPTPWLRTEGLASGRCVQDGAVGYFSVAVTREASDVRTGRIPGRIYQGATILTDWGLHGGDMNLAQGDLIAIVEAQAEAFSRR